MPAHFLTTDYLRSGSLAQRAAWDTLQEISLMERLSAWQPVLAGTVPLDIAVEGSDLDVLCFAQNIEEFARNATRLFEHRTGFVCKYIQPRGVPACVVRFQGRHYPVELFAQPIPNHRQHAFLHLIVSHWLMHEEERVEKQKVIGLKQ